MTQTRAAGATWSGNHRYHAIEVLLPGDLDELAEVVASARTLRVQATRHTFNDIADSDAALVSLERLPTRVEIGGDRVRVEGLVTFAELAPVLEAQGRALHNLGSLPHISVTGATATGTHGSGLRNGNLSSALRAVEIMDADGRTHRVDPSHEWFGAAALSLGALGIVTAVELQTEPTYTVTQEAFTGVGWDDIAADPARVFGGARSVSVFTTWGDPAHDLVWAKSDDGDLSWVAALGGQPVGDDIHLGRIRTVDNTTPRGSSGPWHTRLPHFRADALPSDGDEIQSEYFVPLASAPEALAAVRALAPVIDPHLLVTELRTVAADELWLSPAFQRDVMAIHFTWRNDTDGVLSVLPAIEQALARFDARPHWGKAFTLSGEQIRSTLARVDDFVSVAREADPRGVFRNDYLRRTLGL
ncbi:MULTISPECIES: D-arabinono-1,4-lactone oxidase [Microbacterium]|uniref:D-arabinono-1,4-lactone oxidase n=1 Tax=Microbacterium TaxID=33882 RepID=UPI002780043E|nr:MULTISPECIES: D-arabinono-1,4-lactone oxidase [Microbacterium]MDQ1085173.1 xylitol oxidase [Microbacterium sp. SORGH_AS_0344]MDQ1169521.1 xylitol oxidase [Microbacterium proteolyticum]